MCRKLFLLTSFVVVLGLTGSASAQLIAYEPFDYPANGLSGNDGGSGWNGAWDGGDQQVTAPGLAFSPLLVKGNKATVVGNETESFRDLPEPMGDNETQLWISFVGQADQQPGAAMWGGVSFHEPDESLFLGVPWQDGEGDKVWGLDTKGDENRFTEIPITEKIIFVARVDFNTDGDNDTVTAWAKSINDTDPLDLTDETAFAQYTTRNIEFSRVRIAGNQPVNIDEIRLSMTPPIEPVDMEIGFAAQPPVLDGEVDEIWADASTQYFVPLDDPANASGSWMALYDSENLYVIVDMTDDSLQNDSASSWQDDSVEVYFDGGNTKVNTPLSGDDHQYTFGWTTDDIQGNNFEGYIEGMEHAQVTTDTGWRIEIKMPWLSIQGAAPQAGDLIGIDCYYNDDDDGGDSRENKLLSFSAVEGWNDASQWGTAILAAEPEAEGPNIIWVSFHGADDAPSGPAADVGFTEASDKGYTDLLTANGYNVTRYITSSTPDPEVLNAADLVIISRAVASGGYSNDGATAWNNISAPMIIMGGYVLRSSRMGYTTGTNMPDTTGDITLTVSDPTHPIFAGIPLTDGTMVNPYAGGAVVLPTDGTTVSRGISINNDPADDEGTILATIAEASADTGPVGGMVIAEWPAGATLTHAGGAETDVLAGHRLVFLSGSREPSGVTGGDAAGLYDLFPDGEQMFLNAVKYMLPIEPIVPVTDGLVAYYALENDVLDGSGNGNDGTIVGAPTYVEGPADYGTAMEFHGLVGVYGGGDYIDCGNDASLDITGPISIALWIKPGADDPEGQGTETAPMAKAMSGVGWSWQVRYGWGSPQPYMAFTFNSSPRAWAYVGRNLERDEWCHIACSHDGTTLKCYLNGEQTDSTPMGQIASSEAPVLIGSDGWGCDWIGAIDEVAIYNRALSDSEIMYLAGN